MGAVGSVRPPVPSLSPAGMLTCWLSSVCLLPVVASAPSRTQAGPDWALQDLSHLGGDVGVPNRSCHQRNPVGRKEPVLGKASFTSYPHLQSFTKRVMLQG